MVTLIYELQIPDTGKTVLRGETTRSILGWHKLAVRKALRYKKVSEDVKEHLRNGNSIVGWANSDELQKQMTPEEFRLLVKKVFKGMDKVNK